MGVCVHHLLIQLSVDGHLDCFYHILAIINSAARNNEIHVSLQIRAFAYLDI